MLTRSGRSPGKNHLLERGITLWRCIADDFEQMILIGKHANGERLPTENEIAARYGVNRHTVRRAMAELSARGLVQTERGSGTYVRMDRLAYRIGTHTRFTESVTAAGHAAEGRLHGHRIEPATKDIAERLGLAEGEDVVRLDIVRAADRVPVSVATTWMAADPFHDAAKIFRRTRSITQTLAHYGIQQYRRKWTNISAGFADAIDSGRLRLSVHRPILIVESIDIGPDERPLLTTRGRFAADRMSIVVET